MGEGGGHPNLKIRFEAWHGEGLRGMTALLHEAWGEAWQAHVRRRPRAAVFAEPCIVEGHTRLLLVVLAPWLTEAAEFVRAVAKHARGQPTIVALPQPFDDSLGGSGREWWAYGHHDVTSASSELLNELDLGYRDPNELRTSIAVVQTFLTLVELRGAFGEIALFGSSQGGTLAAHVGVSRRWDSVRHVFAHQPAGIYGHLWDPVKGIAVLIEAVSGYEHGDLEQWRGRLGRRQHCVVLSCSDTDAVAPTPCVAAAGLDFNRSRA